MRGSLGIVIVLGALSCTVGNASSGMSGRAYFWAEIFVGEASLGRTGEPGRIEAAGVEKVLAELAREVLRRRPGRDARASAILEEIPSKYLRCNIPPSIRATDGLVLLK